MLQRTGLTIAYYLLSLAATAQNTTPATQQPVTSYTYKKINPQLSYCFIIDKPTKTHPQEGGQVMLNMQSFYGNTLLSSTAITFKGKPGVYGVAKPAFKGDLIEAIMLMTPGDSIVCLVDADALYKGSNSKKPDIIKPGDKVQYFIKLVSIKTREQVQKEQQAAFMKQIKEQEAKQKAAAAKQMVKDDKILKNYFASQKITPNKTASGLYYSIKEEGIGKLALPGDSVTINYTGKLLDGTKFDSNEDSAFQHVSPYQFVLGQGTVIKGWDEGIALLKTGSKATLYIPSPLAYGQMVRTGSAANPKGIPANSILMFDLRLVSSKHPVPAVPIVPATRIDSLPAAPIKRR